MFLKFESVSKAYHGIPALQGIDLDVARAEVLGLVGENGAGKSTLMKILGGVIQPDSGHVTLEGVSSNGLTIRQSQAAGIAFVHQELNLFDNLTVAANILLHREPLRGGFLRLVDEPAMARLAAPLLARLGAEFPADRSLSSLSLAERQLVEIAKALSMQARLIILDEPTSSLTATETERLLGIVRALRQDGVAVILITHRLAEVQAVADRVAVLRDGRKITELTGPQIRPDVMTRHMVGRDLAQIYRRPARPPADTLLEVDQVRTFRYPTQPITLTVRAGEIVGLAGLIGSGRSELAGTIFGLDRPLSGQIRVAGDPVPPGDPRAAMTAGVCLVPEDRKACGLIVDFSITDNFALPNLPALCRLGLVQRAKTTTLAQEQGSALDLRAAGMGQPVRSLSGGNQQKVVIGKWLARAPRVLIFDEPTRGVDVGAKGEIYGHMRRLADAGAAVLMVSSDMEEVIGVSDRVLVMHEGRIAGELTRDDLSEQSILSLAVGRGQDDLHKEKKRHIA
ncbi:sugar ABC transporter ATP-binding protein [Neogemmobacter tilapiae]|uniref:D-ribose transporter ATP-binding protein n=1 Tax=Neogemmobacter tilapiae TaxID=875041 RepID=A0A918WJU1_9RHOB|nr:sugar ABC transporter ATP-binding protein [Gemmobacter tilapiae]GHC54188.1 D-ribose transporter ATP-binding protein [Gemmobacter tilapiae]